MINVTVINENTLVCFARRVYSFVLDSKEQILTVSRNIRGNHPVFIHHSYRSKTSFSWDPVNVAN